jgi:hypothetical protein
VAGDPIDVAATASPNATTHRPVTAVYFAAYLVGSPDPVAYDSDDTAPYSGQLYIFDPGDYRIEAIAYDGVFSSAPSSVVITVAPPAPRWQPREGLRPGVGDRVLLLGG